MEATVTFAVRERLPPPACESGDMAVAAPQEMASAAQPNQLIRFLPIITAVATVVAMAAVYATRSPVARNPVFLLFPLMMLVSAMATVFSSADRRRGELDARRAEYFGYLTEVRAMVLKTTAAQRESAIWSHPDPDTLWTLVGGRRMWERRADDSDFCQVRIGVGTVPLARRLVVPAMESTHRLDPASVAALERFVRVQSTVSNLPISVSLRGPAVVSIRGDTVQAREILRAVVCQLAVLHGPAEVVIAAVVNDRTRPYWEWLKWLPHNRHPIASDDVGPARMVYPALAVAREALEIPGRQIVIVVDSDEQPCESGDFTTLTIDGRPDEPVVVVASGKDVAAQTDRLSYDAALVCAQRLAGYRPGHTDDSPHGSAWQDLVGITDVASYSPSGCRRGANLRVPVGTRDDGTAVELDIKEAAANGMGPHGLCIGATGSGKSEFLRTVVLGMIVGHAPDELNLVLVDFKGGATFAGLEPAPHVAAVITNLSDKAALVARMRDALMGEMNRRQEELRRAGNLDGIAAYQRMRRMHPERTPLPTLFIVVDEFSELLSQHPDFADVFVAIGRLGRSLGVHLLLASQRLDEGRLRGLESHLSYRVCLKTLSVNESRMVLGSAQAYELPGMPGAAYLRVGTDAPIRFHTALVSGPAAVGFAAAPPPAQSSVPVREFTTAPVGPVCLGPDIDTEPAERLTVLQTIVERLSGEGPRAHEVWLPPLAASPGLDAVLRDADPIRTLTVAIGIVDRPFEQRRTPLVVDLSGAAGNVALVGAPQSGKSTALRTLITALAVTHDPQMLQFYCLDFGGGSLASMRDWPHLGSVAGRADPERVRRTIARLAAVIRSREALFREHGIESMAQYRQLTANGDPLCDRFGDVFLIVDGWLSLQRESEMAEQSITALAADGLSYGVHVVITASRWPEIRPALRDQIGTRIELRLGDPADSEIDRRRAQQVPEGNPGRGLSHDGLHMVIALPRLDADMLRFRRGGYHAPPIPVLPRRIEQSRVVEQALGQGIVVGVEETELRPLAIDFTQQRHLLVLGDSECGKTSALRTLCHELVRATTAQLCIVDPRRSLLGVVDAESGQLGGYLASADAVAEWMPRLTQLLRLRMPSPNVTPTQLRDRSWWAGPEIFVVVDDYDILGGDPLASLSTLLPHSRDLGLHLVVARRTSGAARAMFEPLLAGLRDAGCMTLLMSGSPDEGLTIESVRPSPMPPGRGVLITRRSDPQLVHIGWTPLP